MTSVLGPVAVVGRKIGQESNRNLLRLVRERGRPVVAVAVAVAVRSG